MLKIEEPPAGTKGKHILMVNRAHLETIVKDFKLEGISGYIELAAADLEAVSMAKLATVKKGKIKWLHKEEGDFFKVKFRKETYPPALEKIRGNSLKPGLRVQLTDSKIQISSDSYKGTHFAKTAIKRKKHIVQWVEIIFAELADLAVSLKYPIKVKPGDTLGKDTSIIIENRGTAAAENFHVDLVLSTDNKIDLKSTADSGDPAQGDVLLKNSRQKIDSLKPGETKTLALQGPVTIPENAPPLNTISAPLWTRTIKLKNWKKRIIPMPDL